MKSNRIKKESFLVKPDTLLEQYPITTRSLNTVNNARKNISNILRGKDNRLVVIVGPCSIHDIKAAKEYAKLLKKKSEQHSEKLLIIMRVYFEKPRTTVGWKGLINDPDLNYTFNVNKGLEKARKLLLEISDEGIACATEFLDTITPSYISDLISWGAIGARTTESQLHREMTSGMDCPIGFKNSTNGSIDVSINAILSAISPHKFLGISNNGTSVIIETIGNKDTHIILRGGSDGPNYKQSYVDKAVHLLNKHNLPNKIMIDCSHGNSSKDYKKQSMVINDICNQLSTSNDIFGVMIESNLNEGNQSLTQKLKYGVSITDACVSWNETEYLLDKLALCK